MTKPNIKAEEFFAGFYDVTEINELVDPIETAKAYLEMTYTEVTTPTTDDLIAYLEGIKENITAPELESFFPQKEDITVVRNTSTGEPAYLVDKETLNIAMEEMETSFKDAQCIEALLDCVEYRKEQTVKYVNGVYVCARCGEPITYKPYVYCGCCGQLNHNLWCSGK